jgi:ribosomal protein S18 acetylase RimI-like enzyme
MNHKYFEISDIRDFLIFIDSNLDDTKYFHPHKFDYDTVKFILENKKEDIYLLFYESNGIIGYGILRGWDEGYKIPSLGILIDKSVRGCGYSRRILDTLHEIAKRKFSESIRLTVKTDNNVAINFYEKNGYSFRQYNVDSLEGIFKIA